MTCVWQPTMTIEQLKKLHDAVPFRPFRVHVADGRSFAVPHRDFMSHTPAGRTLIVYDEKDGEGFSILDLLLVTELEVMDTSKGNDKPRRGRRI